MRSTQKKISDYLERIEDVLYSMDELEKDRANANLTQKGADYLNLAIKNMEKLQNHIEEVKFDSDATLKS